MNQDDRLGPYRLLRRLGEGGMGVVHLAVDPQGRQVAVKVLRAEVAGDDVARRRLSREVETMRRVRSEHIAEVLDADVTGHRPYIVTRYVPGRPLDEVVKQDGPLDLPALLKVARGVAAALASVHSVGVIHRDLKPGNVLILDGEPVLIDFGIAQAVDATRLTQTGMFIGTPGYLAPEIIEGHEAGPEVDVHAWAGTLVFAATGEPPFGKGTLEMIFYNITAGKANVAGAPRELQPVLRAALHRDPARRPSAAELVDQVTRLMPQASRPNRHRPPDEITTVPRFDDSASGGFPGSRGPAGSGVRTGPGVSGPPAAGPATGSLLPPDPGEVATPVASRPGTNPAAPWPPAPSLPPREYVSLLGEQQPPADNWPTRRVTAEELRQVAAEQGRENPRGSQAQPASHELPTGMLEPEDIPTGRVRDRGTAPGQSGQAGTGHDQSGRGRTAQGGHGVTGELGATSPVADGDIPTQRVRPHELPEYMRGRMPSPQQSSPQAGRSVAHPQGPGQQGRQVHGQQVHGQQVHGQQVHGQQVHGRPQGLFEQQAPSARHSAAHAPQPPAYQPPPYQPPAPGPVHPGLRPGQPPQQFAAHTAASLLLLAIVTIAAVVAPVLVAAVIVPIAILLRAADIAQPQLSGRRGTAPAAADAFRVFSHPGALLKSIGVTVALVPYGLILGLPVTLLLAVLVPAMPEVNTLAWGTAVALWTICAGPGVEAPGRQMRRSLASLLPSRGAAAGTAAALGVVVVLMVFLAVGTVGDRAREATWAPVDVRIGTVVDELQQLRKRAQ
ncbi:serine/threonine-protein kinase [Planobispora rosea]|nr:serine/threonine-protein kinase [Planobispora rosea]